MRLQNAAKTGASMWVPNQSDEEDAARLRVRSAAARRRWKASASSSMRSAWPSTAAFVGQHEAIGGALKQRLAHGGFERAQPPAHGRLRLAELAGGGAERAFARDRQEDRRSLHSIAQTPSIQICMDIVLYLLISMQTECGHIGLQTTEQHDHDDTINDAAAV